LHEISLFINNDIIESFEKSWLLESYVKTWHIDTSILTKNIEINNSTMAIVDLLEEVKWEKANVSRGRDK